MQFTASKAVGQECLFELSQAKLQFFSVKPYSFFFNFFCSGTLHALKWQREQSFVLIDYFFPSQIIGLNLLYFFPCNIQIVLHFDIFSHPSMKSAGYRSYGSYKITTKLFNGEGVV